MKRFEKRMSEPREYEALISVVCDLCGQESQGDDWEEETCEIKETAISLREGSRYPDNGQDETTSFDICPDCFKTKLIPWFKAQGATPGFDESDW